MAWIELRVLPLASFRIGCLILFVTLLGLLATLVVALLFLVSVAGILLVLVLLVTHGSLQTEARPDWPVSKHRRPKFIAAEQEPGPRSEHRGKSGKCPTGFECPVSTLPQVVRNRHADKNIRFYRLDGLGYCRLAGRSLGEDIRRQRENR